MSKSRLPARSTRLSAASAPGWQIGDTVQLTESAARLGIALDGDSTARLARYAALLLRWNRTFNLLGATTVDELRDLHLLDCLSINPVLERWLTVPSPHIYDIGSGAGLPGIPLAITHPEWSLTLVEPVSKKAAFLRQSIATLGLNNVKVVEDRIESLPAATDTTDCRRHFVSRAFTALDRFYQLCRAAASDQSLIFAMKAARVREEIAELPTDAAVLAVESLPTARTGHERVVVVLATGAIHAN